MRRTNSPLHFRKEFSGLSPYASVQLEVGNQLGVMSQLPMNPLRSRWGAYPSHLPQALVRGYK